MTAKQQQRPRCAECGKDHPRCTGHRRKIRDEQGRLIPCMKAPIRGLDRCVNHVGIRRDLAVANGHAKVDRAAAVEKVEKHRARLGVEAVDEPHEVTALREIRKARGNVAAWQVVVDELVDSKDGDVVAALGVHTGSKAKPNEVEKHFALARLDEERDRLMDWIATARRLGIEQARLEHEERLAQSQGERIVAVLRMSLDQSKRALLDAGVQADVVNRWHREQLPLIVRAAIDATSDEVLPA